MNKNDEEFETIFDDNEEEMNSDFEEPDYGNYDYNETLSTSPESFNSGDQIVSPNQNITPANNEINNTNNIITPKRENVTENLNNNQANNLQKQPKKQLAEANSENEKNLITKVKKNPKENKNELNKSNKKKVNSSSENGIGNRIQNVKSRRSSIFNNSQSSNTTSDEKKENIKKDDNNKNSAENQPEEKKKGLDKIKDKKNKLLNRDSSEKEKRKNPLNAAKKAVNKALNKLKKLLVLKVLLPVLLIIVILAIIVDVIYEVFEVVDDAFTAIANVQEKFDNFTNGLGFQNSEEAFYEDLEEQQKAYDNEINVPLLFSTLFYDDIQNNMNPTEVGAEVVTGEESLISFATVFDYVKSKYDESNSHVGKDGLRYSSNKIYRMRMLAKNMVSKSGTKTASIPEYWDKVSSRIGDAFLEMIDITDILQMVFSPADFLESVYQILVGDEVFETTDFGNMIHDNKITDVFDFLGAIFEGIFDIESISIEGVTYSSYKYDEEAYWKYLKENYIPRMPEFKRYINSDDENIRKQEIDNIIKGIKDIYEDYKYYFEQKPQNAEVYYEDGVGGIDNVLVRALRKPVDGNFTGFKGRDAFGVYNGRMQNGVVITHANSGINVGDPVYSVAKGKIVGIGRKTGEIEGSSLGDQTLGSFTKYNLTDHELKGLALLCQHEQGSIEGSKAEASLIANKYEYSKSTKSLHEYVKTNIWWRSGSIYLSDENPQPNQEILEAVRDVLVNGNRTLPKYITEHDSLTSGEILWIENNGTRYSDSASIQNINLYIKDVTKIKTTHHDSSEYYVFYSFPTSDSDPFGYYPRIYNMMKDDNSSSSTTTNKSNWVKIEHTVAVDGLTYNFTTIYNGLGTITEGLKVGDYVEKGAVIGTVGIVDYLDNSASSSYTEASLYFEFRDENYNPVNPTNLFIPITNNLLIGDSNDVIIANFLLEKGFTPVQTSVILANMYYESNAYNPKDINDKDCRGICQWCFGRKVNLLKYASSKNDAWDSLDTQLAYLMGELRREGDAVSYTSSYQGYVDALNNYSESQINEAVEYFCNTFEVPGEISCRGRKTNKINGKTKGEEWLERIKEAQSSGIKLGSNGNYIWPAESTTVSDIFGNRYEEMQAHRSSYGEGGTVIHKALDISNASGKPYYAICDGIIERVNDSAYHITELNCGKNTKGDEVHIIYEHGDAANGLKKGQSVKTGTLLGTSNGWGKSKGPNSYKPHLHFEVYTLDSNGKKVYNNPLMYLYGMTYDGKDDGKMTCNIKHQNGSNILYITASNYASNGLNKEAVNFMYKYSTGAYDQSDIYNQKGNFYN